MTLFSIDKSNSDRGVASPNSVDKLRQRMSHKTMSTAYSSPGTAASQRAVFKNNMMVFYDASNNITSVYGVIESVGSTPVLIIAKSGKDVFADVLGISRPEGL